MATGRRKSKTSKRLPWWKKHPEIERITRHIGKIIDNSRPEDWVNVALYGAAAIAGYQAARRLGADWINALGGAATGLVAMRLAQSGNLIAGASGAAALGVIGLIDVWNPLVSAAPQIFVYLGEELGKVVTETVPGMEEIVKGQKVIEESLKKARETYKQTGKLPEFCSKDIFGNVKCYTPGFGWVHMDW